MLDKVFIKAQAKINLFLHIINKRDDGFYNIRSGVTFLDLYDEVSIEISNTQSLTYSGPFKPHLNFFENDIIIKTLNLLKLKKNIKLKLHIKKNIPTQSGLGSASTNAAALIKGLIKLGIIDKKNNKFLSILGADVPACFYGDDCIITGIGNIIYKQISHPKYYFLLVKPNINLSTKDMYSKIKHCLHHKNKTNNMNSPQDEEERNDFEKIAKIENKKITNLLDFLSNIDDCIFARMTGSGSCCYAVFNEKEHARRAKININNKFSNLWSYLGENNAINN